MVDILEHCGRLFLNEQREANMAKGQMSESREALICLYALEAIKRTHDKVLGTDQQRVKEFLALIDETRKKQSRDLHLVVSYLAQSGNTDAKLVRKKTKDVMNRLRGFAADETPRSALASAECLFIELWAFVFNYGANGPGSKGFSRFYNGLVDG